MKVGMIQSVDITNQAISKKSNINNKKQISDIPFTAGKWRPAENILGAIGTLAGASILGPLGAWIGMNAGVAIGEISDDLDESNADSSETTYDSDDYSGRGGLTGI